MSGGREYTVEVQQAIARTAAGILTAPYRGEKLPAMEPQRRTVMHDAWHGGRLSGRHQIAWQMVINLFRDAAGESPRSTGVYADAVPSGDTDGFRVPTARENWQLQQLNRLCNEHLHDHERRLLKILAQETFQNCKMHSLGQLGKLMDGYGDDAQSRAAGVSTIHRLLDSVCEFFQI